MTKAMERFDPAASAVVAVWLALAGCIGSVARADTAASTGPIVETISVKLPAGGAKVDLYWPGSGSPAPLVIVAHGFSRHRRHMSGWGQHLASEGFAVAVPDLPAWSDQARNGRFISELRAHLCAEGPWRRRIDPSRVGMAGFSAGGLASLLAAADSPDWAIWVGLDPVDRNGLGAKAASRVKCRAVVLTAEPSSCNARGNVRAIIAALPRCEHFGIPGAVHVDAEWPTDRMGEAFCGRSTEDKRGEFRRRATAALLEALAERPAAQTEAKSKTGAP